MSKHVALIREVRHANQFIGLPAEVSNSDLPVAMPSADLVVIEGSEGSFTLNRYTIQGEFSGDTWHASLEDAFHQASYEFGLGELEWTLVPDSIDPIAFAKERGR